MTLIMIELFFVCLQKSMGVSEHGIKIGHGVQRSCSVASKTILCQAVLTAKGGLKRCPLHAICGFHIQLQLTRIVFFLALL